MRAHLIVAAVVLFSVATTPAMARDPALPPGGQWIQHDPNRRCETYIRPGSGHIATTFTINGERYVFRRGPDCNLRNTHGSTGAKWVTL